MIDVEIETHLPEIHSNSFEPKIVFQFQDGLGGMTTQIETFHGIKERIRQAISATRPLVATLRSLHVERNRIQKRGVTGSGKPYNRSERRQILRQIGIQEADTMAKLRNALSNGTRVIEQTDWLIRSPAEKPLTVLFVDGRQGKLVSGEPLREEEACWQVFMADKNEPGFWNHPKIYLARNYFIARNILGRQEEIPPEKKEQAEKFLGYLQLNANDIPDDLVPLIRKITDLDFSRPLLPELETLKKLSS